MTKTMELLSQYHRTFDCGTFEDGSEWMSCDCHGYYLVRTVVNGKRGKWMRVIVK